VVDVTRAPNGFVARTPAVSNAGVLPNPAAESPVVARTRDLQGLDSRIPVVATASVA
jgi:hypothetical protein